MGPASRPASRRRGYVFLVLFILSVHSTAAALARSVPSLGSLRSPHSVTSLLQCVSCSGPASERWAARTSLRLPARPPYRRPPGRLASLDTLCPTFAYRRAATVSWRRPTLARPGLRARGKPGELRPTGSHPFYTLGIYCPFYCLEFIDGPKERMTAPRDGWLGLSFSRLATLACR